MDLTELSSLTELSEEITMNDIDKIKLELVLPSALFEVTKGIDFLLAMKRWQGLNPFLFHQVLQHIRPDLLIIANKIPWLCNASASTDESTDNQLSIRSLIELLKAELTLEKQKLIIISISREVEENINIELTLNKLVEKGIIHKDLEKLTRLMQAIKRNDLVNKLKTFRSVFIQMEDEQFIFEFKKALKSLVKEIAVWMLSLKKYLSIKYSKVTQMLGDDETVNLVYTYVNLTIIKQKPRPINIEDETTFNEIAFLRKIARKEIEIFPVDFTDELMSCTAETPEIWYLIGNPGCGKTFLSKRIALRFSQYELTHISYSIAIPCRNTDWHNMESIRVEDERTITAEFVQEWLCIGLPVASEWPKDLAKHLTKSDGEGLLLIIDGLDEFIKKVPFEKTLLYLLLTRQTLHRSNIILTTRPGAWTDISSRYELKVDRYYQVLGFSPENRDLYFRKQIVSEYRLNECKRLLKRYDEMNQLALIPVNASLFAALLKDESVSIHTLTQLYDELTCYLIRRQLCRMGLEELAEVKNIKFFHFCVQDCLHSIGKIALGGVGRRELTSTEKVPLIIDYIEIESHCLGLAHEYYKKEAVGIITKVWGFAHLTMQEFTSAIFLRSTSWIDQCMSIRFIADSDENFYLFRMVVRFICGLLSERSTAVLTILYRKLTPQVIQDLPMYYLLEYDYSLKVHTGWYEYTKIFFQLSPNLFEANSKSIINCFNQFLQNSFSIYLNEKVLPVSPNEWACFLQSLQLVDHIQLIYIDTNYVNLTQFKSLLKSIGNSPISYIALNFYGKYSTKVLSYTYLFREIKIGIETKISIQLLNCTHTGAPAVNIFSTNLNMNIASMRFSNNKYSNQLIDQIANNHISALHYLYIDEEYSEDKTIYEVILPALSNATRLRGLYLDWIPYEYKRNVIHTLSTLPELQEISFSTYSLLPYITQLSSISFLEITRIRREDTELSDYLIELINTNQHTIRGLKLEHLQYIGFKRWNGFLNALHLCVYLVQLELSNIQLIDDVTQWTTTLPELNSLVQLKFIVVKLFDTGLISVCEGLIAHPTIRYLYVCHCEQTSESCEALTNLIHTVSYLERLIINKLSEPDPEPIKILEQTAEEYSIVTDFDQFR